MNVALPTFYSSAPSSQSSTSATAELNYTAMNQPPRLSEFKIKQHKKEKQTKESMSVRGEVRLMAALSLLCVLHDGRGNFFLLETGHIPKTQPKSPEVKVEV